MRRSLPFIALVVGLLGPAIPAVAGGGSWLESPRQSHEPGEDVTLVGYTGSAGRWVDQGPWMGSLNVRPTDVAFTEPDWVEVGEAVLEDTPIGGYLAYRMTLTFTLPDDLEPGFYDVIVRNADGAMPGDFVGGWVAVGTAWEDPRWVEWPLDEPLIAELADDAVIAGPGFQVTVAELRRGEYPPGAAQFMFDPSVLPTTTTTSTTTTSTTTTTTVAVDPAVAEAVQILTDLPPTPQDPGAPPEGVAGGQDPAGNRVPVSGTSIAGMLAAAALLGGAAAWLWVRQRRQRHHPSWRP